MTTFRQYVLPIIIVVGIVTIGFAGNVMAAPMEDPAHRNNTTDGANSYHTSGESGAPLSHLSEANSLEKVGNITYGGPEDDYLQSIKPAHDGGYLLAGQTHSYGAENGDGWAVKIDDMGAEEWNTTYGGTKDDYLGRIQPTSDGGYLLAGYTESYGSAESDGWVVKVDDTGAEEWNTTYGGSNSDTLWSVESSPDGGYLIAGYTDSYGPGNRDGWLVKVDKSGNEEWNRTFGGAFFDHLSTIQSIDDGGYLLSGQTDSFGTKEFDGWIVKVDENGNEKWNKTYGGPESDALNSIQSTSDGGYLLAGMKGSYGSIQDGWLVKIDDTGTEVWNTTYSGDFDDDFLYSIQPSSDGGYLLVGQTGSYIRGTGDGWLIKVDKRGKKEWETTYGKRNLTTKNKNNDYLLSSQSTPLGTGYVFAGSTQSYGSGKSDGWLVIVKSSPMRDRPGDVTGNGETATDPDGDNLYEDLTGDGNVDARDVLALWNNRNKLTPHDFDFTGDGSVDARDVLELWNQL